MNEYIAKRMSGAALETELLRLIKKYNKLTGSYLVVYAGALNKSLPQVSMSMDDYYVIADLLRDVTADPLDMYIETPGGRGDAAEEIVNCLRRNRQTVNFVVSGEAKSAGTLVVLSGNDIYMTHTGSLGPVDAQVMIGRGQISAHDYMEWVNEKRTEAAKTGQLNPFDATMAAQISPGELNGASNALEFAHDLVVKWLPRYKFKNWNQTETTKKKVTDATKQKRAQQIAKALTNHSRWRSHGRSLKIADLEEIGLKIKLVDDNPELCDVVYRIQVVLRLLFSTTTAYKIFATESSKILATATQANAPVAAQQAIPQQKPDSVQLEVPCPKCGIAHKLYGKFVNNKTIDANMAAQGYKPFPPNAKLVCVCGFEMDLTGVKNNIETNIGRRMVQ